VTSPGDRDVYRERLWHAADDLPLYLRDYGDPYAARTPMLCLSGLTRNAADFDTVARRLAAGGRRVICPDYRGRGRSGRAADWRTYAPPRLVADLLDLLAMLDLHRVAVIGTSLGGLLAMGLAVARPSVLAAVVLNDVGPDVHAKGLGRIADFIRRDRPQPDWESAEAELRRRLPTLGLADDDAWRRFTRGTYREGADGRLHFDWDVRLVRTLGGPVPDLWPLFGALARVPVLAVRGGVSDVLTAATLQRMGATRPDLRALVVPGVGHAPSLDEPECRAAIDDLLRTADNKIDTEH